MKNVGSFCATQTDMGTLADSEGHSQRFPSFDLHAATNCSNKIVQYSPDCKQKPEILQYKKPFTLSAGSAC